MNAKEWHNEIVNGRVGGNHAELIAIADAIDELQRERNSLLAAAEYAYKTLDGGSGLHPRSIVGMKVLDRLLYAIAKAEGTT